LTEFKTQFRGGWPAKLRALPAVTVVCLALLALLTVVQVAHTHPLETDADHCQLCIAMHTAAPVAVAAVVVVLVKVGTQAPLVVARVAVRHRHPKLFIRPPPIGC